MLIPPEQLSPDALMGLVEEFITREGTDYGVTEVALQSKVDQVIGQIRKGDVLIVFDGTSGTVNLMTKNDYRQWSVE